MIQSPRKEIENAEEKMQLRANKIEIPVSSQDQNSRVPVSKKSSIKPHSVNSQDNLDLGGEDDLQTFPNADGDQPDQREQADVPIE